LVNQDKITGKAAKEVLDEVFKTGKMPTEIVAAKGLTKISDESKIEEVIEKVVQDVKNKNEKALEDVKKNPNTLKYFIGLVMRETKGQADPQVVEEILTRLLIE
jgi:aspartyl-tRNA(Asn)/glutamyl-tRNA(Gln) amidotransferase subunit B